MLIQIGKLSTMCGYLDMELIILLMFGVISVFASMETQGPYDPDVWEGVTEARQDIKLTNLREETMEGRGRQWNNQALGLETVDREGKRFVPSR